jgi:hypothetical protein
MSTPFETAILKLKDLGFFQFLLPFMITAAVFYGLLRKTQLFGDPEKNITVNAIVALSASLFVWAAPIILGVDIEAHLAAFFIQGFVVTLVFIIALILAGMFFPPDLPKALGERIKTGWLWSAIVIIVLIIGVVLLVSSGLYQIIFPNVSIHVSSDIFITIGMLILVIVVIFAITRGAK